MINDKWPESYDYYMVSTRAYTTASINKRPFGRAAGTFNTDPRVYLWVGSYLARLSWSIVSWAVAWFRDDESTTTITALQFVFNIIHLPRTFFLLSFVSALELVRSSMRPLSAQQFHALNCIVRNTKQFAKHNKCSKSCVLLLTPTISITDLIIRLDSTRDCNFSKAIM